MSEKTTKAIAATMKGTVVVLLFLATSVAVAVARGRRAAEDAGGGFRERRLQMIQNEYPSGWPYLGHCLYPEGSGGIFNYGLRVCEESETPPFETDSRIAIVGAYVAGLPERGMLSLISLSLSLSYTPF